MGRWMTSHGLTPVHKEIIYGNISLPMQSMADMTGQLLEDIVFVLRNPVMTVLVRSSIQYCTAEF